MKEDNWVKVENKKILLIIISFIDYRAVVVFIITETFIYLSYLKCNFIPSCESIKPSFL